LAIKKVQGEMKTSEQTNEIAAALAKAQGRMKNPAKNRAASIPMKSGGKYEYNYADLSTTLDCNREVLSESGISYSAAPHYQGENYTLCARLSHSSGQWYEAEWALPNGGDPKLIAASITYGFRYLFSSLTGITGDEDLDSDPEDSAVYEPREALKPSATPAVVIKPASTPAEYTIPFGRLKGKTLKAVGVEDLLAFSNEIKDKARAEKKGITGVVEDFITRAATFAMAGAFPIESDLPLDFNRVK
jgi:hypothetical protein